MTDEARDAKPRDEPPAAATPPPGAPPPTRDPPPSPRSGGRGGARPGAGRPKGSKTKTAAAKKPQTPAAAATTDAKLRANLKAILEIPVIPARQAGFAFAVAHFSESAGPTADLVVRASQTWPELRHFLTSADELVSGKVLFAAAIAGYLAPIGLFLLGQPQLAFGISPATPEQVHGIEVLLQLPPELQAQVRQMQAGGWPPDRIAAELPRILQTYYDSQATNGQGTPAGQPPPPPGATPASPAS